MPFGIPSEIFNGGFGIPSKDDESNTCNLCQHNACSTCIYKKRCIDDDKGMGCVCDDCVNGSKFKNI